MRQRISKSLAPITAITAGALTAWLSFAPVGWWWFPYLGLAALAVLLTATVNTRTATLLGFLFGLAFFTVGVSWVRISMYEFGGMPLALAWSCALLFCAFLALYPALAACFVNMLRPHGVFFQATVFASAWSFTEYLRAHLFTGFEWLSIGVSAAQWTPAAFVAPLLGVFGQGFFIAFIAALLGLSIAAWYRSRHMPWLPLSLSAALTLALPVLFSFVHFSEPVGKPIKVSLLQGNIAQTMKWDVSQFVDTLHRYQSLIERAQGQLIILPETAIPAPVERIPSGYLEELEKIAKARSANLVIGLIQYEQNRYYNAVITRGIDPEQSYRKVHLVPFGEHMPLRGLLGWFYARFVVPMGDMHAGDVSQPALRLNEQALGVSICYEDAFARDVQRTLDDATLLLNVSNDAWFGHSIAAEQHMQLAQLRALEFARPMLRANNTGITAIIDEKGRVISRLPSFTEDILEFSIDGRRGYTPYTVWGDLPILLLCLASLCIGLASRLQNRKR